MSKITEQLTLVRQQIQLAIQSAQRTDAVELLAVSKTNPLEAVIQAYQAGQRQFGENYVQEGVDKIKTSQNADWLIEPIEWHFIGPLQSNKTRLVAEHFNWVQTIDRLKIAQRLSEQRPPELGPLNLCIQVNISQEASKSGIHLNELMPLAEAIHNLPNITLRGLMAIPQPAGSHSSLAQEFEALYQAYQKIQLRYPSVDTLSMGMTTDMAQAIAHGSTMVRIGTAIFGQRDYSLKDA
jgi:pyridoxal phosphate enzyme (YggS family)